MNGHQAQHDPHPRIVQVNISTNAAPVQADMSQGVTLGFQEPGLQKPPGKHARRKLRLRDPQWAAQWAKEQAEKNGKKGKASAANNTSGVPDGQQSDLDAINSDLRQKGSTQLPLTSLNGQSSGPSNLPTHGQPTTGSAAQQAPTEKRSYNFRQSTLNSQLSPGLTAQASFVSQAMYNSLPPLRFDHTNGHATPLPPSGSKFNTAQWRGTLPYIGQTNVPPMPQASTAPPPPASKPSRAERKALVKDSLIPLPAPKPSQNYMMQAHNAPVQLTSPQRLLLILDLNGTLLFRPNASTTFTPRPCLEEFLNYSCANHSILIWSSAKPYNVKGVCEQLFTPKQREALLGEWGRDTLDLTAQQYASRVQVYKRLDKVWNDPKIEASHPGSKQSGTWGQHNTLLIDDSAIKASAQPYNHIEVPEYIRSNKKREGANKTAVLAQVVGYVEEARRWSDVSAFVRRRKFEMYQGWRWDFGRKGGQGGDVSQDDRSDQDEKKVAKEVIDLTSSDDEDGGVKI